MLIADKYEVKVKVAMKSWKIMEIRFIMPVNMCKEQPGIVQQFEANSLFGIIDDFPLD